MYSMVTIVSDTVLYTQNFLRVDFLCPPHRDKANYKRWLTCYLVDQGNHFTIYTYIKSSHCTIYTIFIYQFYATMGFPSGKESTYSAGDAGDTGLIPGLERPPKGGYGNPL